MDDNPYQAPKESSELATEARAVRAPLGCMSFAAMLAIVAASSIVAKLLEPEGIHQWVSFPLLAVGGIAVYLIMRR